MPVIVKLLAMLLTVADAPLQLGKIPEFATEREALRDCPGDLVVWADRDTGYFYPKARPQYGHTAAGAYTCLKAARQADYWDINPFSPYGDPKAGRDFPIDPSLLEPGV